MKEQFIIDGDFEDFIISKRLQLKDSCVIYLSGSRMSTVYNLYEQLQSALQLPNYFGSNWNAFLECIRNLDWFWQKKFLIAVDDFDKILCDCGLSQKDKNEELYYFEFCLKQAVKEWKGNLQVLINENNKVYQLMPDEENYRFE